ncbi:STN domain-containing protein [Flammeovirga sp. EKP202]|uniref:STN domain-containing protein n=1 Tax=Flammeovirga sp. EKP202 TaxID=2770592 RepID=UPI00165F5F46|nr:STN domain-containing protein [Flammeovirga sp. EKP202]MBD0401060.1 STN domain-containing protein [Flammeovirga sp. EKP202]
MKHRLFILFLFLSLLIHPVFANNEEGDLLQRVISIEIKKQTLEAALDEIKDQGGFSFSYNPSILDLTQEINFKGQNVTVKAALIDILGYNYEFKQIGMHVIIREAFSLTIRPIDQRKRKTKEELQRLKEDILLNGRVVDASTGMGLQNVVVYDESQKVLTLTDSMGYYALKVPLERMQKGVYFRNRGFYDTMVQFNPGDDENEVLYNVGLSPYNENSNPIDSDLTLSTQNPHQLNIVKRFVPKKVDIISNSIEYIEHRTAQFTLVPFLSNSNFLGGSYTNRLSFNTLIGYSAGVDRGGEIGGLVNINRFHMQGAQIGGISNIVGGNVTGAQIGGIVNYNMGEVNGMQVGGITNIVADSVFGVQIGGINNVVRENVKGVQVGGITSATRTFVKGLQLSGIYSYAKEIQGAQVSGILNTNQKDIKGMQLAGIANYSNSVIGWQVSGIYNHTSNEIKGMQVAGIYNFADTLKGVQIGLINVANDGAKGLPIGLFSYYKNGYHSVSYHLDEFSMLNLSFQTGTRKFYNYYKVGTSIFNSGYLDGYQGYHFGIGFGAYLFKRLLIEAGMHGNYNDATSEFEHRFVKWSLMYEQPIWKRISITAGPSVNYDPFIQNNEYSAPPSFYSEQTDIGLFWISGSVGIRFSW